MGKLGCDEPMLMAAFDFEHWAQAAGLDEAPMPTTGRAALRPLSPLPTQAARPTPPRRDTLAPMLPVARTPPPGFGRATQAGLGPPAAAADAERASAAAEGCGGACTELKAQLAEAHLAAQRQQAEAQREAAESRRQLADAEQRAAGHRELAHAARSACTQMMAELAAEARGPGYPIATPTSCARAAPGAHELHESLAQARAELATQRDAATEQHRELSHLRGLVGKHTARAQAALDERRASAQAAQAQAEAARRASAAAAQRKTGLCGVSEAARVLCDELMVQLGHANRDSDELRWALVQAMATVDSLEDQLECVGGAAGVAACGKVGVIQGGRAEGSWGQGCDAMRVTVQRGVACA